MNHQKVSFAKSGIRIIGFGFLLSNLMLAVLLLIMAEVLGVIEEL